MKRQFLVLFILVGLLAITLTWTSGNAVVPTAECGTQVNCLNCSGQCHEWALDHYSACVVTGNNSDFCWDSHNKFKFQCGNTYCPNCGWVETYRYIN